MSDGYVYTVNNKQGKAVDFWVMDKPKPNEASVIFSCRFSRYVKPKSKPIMKMIDDALHAGRRNTKVILILDLIRVAPQDDRTVDRRNDAHPFGMPAAGQLDRRVPHGLMDIFSVFPVKNEMLALSRNDPDLLL